MHFTIGFSRLTFSRFFPHDSAGFEEGCIGTHRLFPQFCWNFQDPYWMIYYYYDYYTSPEGVRSLRRIALLCYSSKTTDPFRRYNTSYISPIYRLYTSYISPIYRLYIAYIPPIYRLYTAYIYRLYIAYIPPIYITQWITLLYLWLMKYIVTYLPLTLL